MSDLRRIDLTSDDFRTADWARVLESIVDGANYDYANAFYDRAAEAGQHGDLRAEAVFRLLGDLSSFSLRSDRPDEPFRAGIITDAHHSALPDSLSRPVLELLREVAPTVRDPWMRARMADFVWSRARGYPMARLAIDSYLDLAVRLGPANDMYATVRVYIEGVLDQVRVNEPSMLSHRLLRLAGQHAISDPVVMHRLAAEHAQCTEDTGELVPGRAILLGA